MLGPVWLAVGRHAQRAEPGDVLGLNHLEMRDVMPVIVRSVHFQRGFDGVERDANRSVADRVHVDLEPQGVEACYRVGQRLSVHVGETAVRRLRTVRPQVGVEQSPGEVLEDTVDHDLHGVDVEASMIVRTGFASQLDATSEP